MEIYINNYRELKELGVIVASDQFFIQPKKKIIYTYTYL